MKIAFVGDVHGQLVKMYAALMDWMERTGVKIDAVVQVGDLGVYSDTDFGAMFANQTPAPIPTWACMGNHEDPALLKVWQNTQDRIPGLRLLPDGEITDIGGVRVGAIWGNFSFVSWKNPGRVVQHRDVILPGHNHSDRIAMHISRGAVDNLLEQPGPMDVFITHDSASSTMPARFRTPMDGVTKEILGLEKWEPAGGCPGFDDILMKFAPKYYFFGHLHTYEKSVGQTTTVCLDALGYSGNWCEVIEL